MKKGLFLKWKKKLTDYFWLRPRQWSGGTTLLPGERISCHLCDSLLPLFLAPFHGQLCCILFWNWFLIRNHSDWKLISVYLLLEVSDNAEWRASSSSNPFDDILKIKISSLIINKKINIFSRVQKIYIKSSKFHWFQIIDKIKFSIWFSLCHLWFNVLSQ